MPTLAELRAQSGPKPLPRTTKVVTLVEGQHLLDEAEQLADELMTLARESDSISARIEPQDPDRRTAPPVKSGEVAKLRRRKKEIETRSEGIRDRQNAILDELADVQGELGLTGMTGGEWERFKTANPPREKDDNDRRYTGGVCDSSALFAALGQFVSAWDGEAVSEDDWDGWLAERITYADRRDLVPSIVDLHEKKLNRSPKFRSASPTTSRSESD